MAQEGNVSKPLWKSKLFVGTLIFCFVMLLLIFSPNITGFFTKTEQPKLSLDDIEIKTLKWDSIRIEDNKTLGRIDLVLDVHTANTPYLRVLLDGDSLGDTMYSINSPGDNKIHLDDVEIWYIYDDYTLMVCWSYDPDFSQKMCKSAILEHPTIDLEVSPSVLEYNLNVGHGNTYEEKKVEIKNNGDSIRPIRITCGTERLDEPLLDCHGILNGLHAGESYSASITALTSISPYRTREGVYSYELKIWFGSSYPEYEKVIPIKINVQ